MQQNWTIEQTIIALYLYCQIPFNKVTDNNTEIIKMSKIIGRSVASLKMKIGNFGSFDPALRQKGIVGLQNASKLDKTVWERYFGKWNDLAFDATKILAKYTGNDNEILDLTEGTEREQIVKRRIGQTFFRNMVLSAYNNKCCITGVSIVCLLEACHIVGWADNASYRTDPQNGLPLNALFHRAYDNNYIGITPDYIIKVSSKLYDDSSADNNTKLFVKEYDNRKIILPNRFLPKQNLLAERFCHFLP